MKQKALIVKTNENGTAIVTVLQKSACSSCSSRHVCGTAKKTESTVNNKIGAKIGDTVEIEVPSSNVLGYSALVFLAPVLLALILYFALSGIGELWGILGATAGFIIPFVIAFFISKASADKVRPNITAILAGEKADPDEGNECDMQK